MANDDIPHTKRTFTFKEVRGKPLQLDVYYPPQDNAVHTPHPVILYFHGGGAVTGDRTFIRPWFLRAAMRRNWTIVSADYRCLPESTGLDVLSDLHDAYLWVTQRAGDALPERRIDLARVIVHGDSGGGYCALLLTTYLAHLPPAPAVPAPRALWLLYPMVDPADPARVRVGQSVGGTPVTDESATLTEIDARIAAGEVSFGEAYAALDMISVISQQRWPYLKAITQEGLWVEYLTGVRGLREAIVEKGAEADGVVEERLRVLFPLHFGRVGGRMPPVVVVHGNADAMVPVEESLRLAERCKDAGVSVEKWIVDGKDHVFDLAPGYEDVDTPGGEEGVQAIRQSIEALEKYIYSSR